MPLPDLSFLEPYFHRPERVRHYLDLVEDALERGMIRNVDFKDAKDVLGRAVDKAWEDQVKKPFFYAGKYAEQSPEVQELDLAISVSNLHNVLSASKKVAKAEGKASGPAFEAMKSFCEQVLPLSQLMVELKPMIVKGRAPADPEKAAANENPHKVLGTCACCSRTQAVVGKTMAKHGYQRPGWGQQTQGCSGDRFPPLEVSSVGVKYQLDSMKALFEKAGRAYAELPGCQSLEVRRGLRVETVTPADRGWRNAYAREEGKIVSAIRYAKDMIPDLEKKIEDWKPGKLYTVRGIEVEADSPAP